uniref:2-hydroxychromene-2-carboxylate isomerase n=1 Tax=Chamaesiphon sp. VAR_48_metabat_403 TaxID=2964700 RepID=UPI00286D75B4
MITSANVDFYYAIGSRYSYLASTQIDALKTATGCHVEWHPINSVRLISQRDRNPFTGKPSGKYEWAYRELDAQRWAKLYGVPYLEPRGRVQFDSELLARACVAAKQFDKVVEYSHLLFAAMFKDSLTQIDERECIDRAEICGISTKDFQVALKSQETASQLDETIDNAINAGVFGVPTFIVNGELFWGNDRLILLHHCLDSDRFEAWKSRLVSNPDIL